MSLYNLVHGTNPLAPVLLGVLGLRPDDIPRFRDCWYKDGQIVVYTRTGGGNRAYYDERNDDNEDGPWNSTIRAVPGFLRDEDDDFDSTYASFYFEFPKEFDMIREKLDGNEAANPKSPRERWDEAIANLKDPNNSQAKRVTEALAPLLDAIQRSL